MNLLNRVDFLPAFLERLKSEPEKVVKEFEAFRDGCEWLGAFIAITDL